MAELQIREVPTGSPHEVGILFAFVVYPVTAYFIAGWIYFFSADLFGISIPNFSDAFYLLVNEGNFLPLTLILAPTILIAGLLALAASRSGIISLIFGLAPTWLMFFIWAAWFIESGFSIDEMKGESPLWHLIFPLILSLVWCVLNEGARQSLRGEANKTQSTTLIGRTL